MSDVYIPGIRSRFNTGQIVDDLMKIERIPRDRTERNIDTLETRKIWWQNLGRRVASLRESARFLFLSQNPFNERTAVSADENVITATATREAVEQDYRFAVKQLAQADRFLSPPLDEKTRVEAGNYSFTVGQEEITVNFRGGTLRDFAEAVNRRGRDKIGASLITVQPGTRSLLLESKVTGAENRLGFTGEAADLAVKLGIVEQSNDSRRDIQIGPDTVRETPSNTAPNSVSINDGTLELPSLSAATVPFGLRVDQGTPLVLKLETSTRVTDAGFEIQQPPPGPNVPSSGSASYGGITVENSPSTAPLPQWTAPAAPKRTDNLAVLSLTFSDGTKAALPPITDSGEFVPRQYGLAEIAGGKTITAVSIDNNNTHRDISVRNLSVLDPAALGGGYKPKNAVSTAQDAIITMEGIEMFRPSNSISDIIPGVTITARGVSERPVRLGVQADREGIKNSIVTMVGHYNLLMAELNVLTRNDERIINELTYLDRDEAAEMKDRLGKFSTETSLSQLKANLQRTVSSPYPTDAGRDLALLAQIGISTSAQSAGGAGINASQLRGYLQIDERTLDAAIERDLPAIKQLFASDTTGDLIPDTGIAFNLDFLSQPFVGTGGIISLKTGTIDSRISQDTRRIETMDRQLAAREAALRLQYSRMESAYARMEQMSNSLDNFSQQNSNNR
jgi:flagellar hook-associated protein 2